MNQMLTYLNAGIYLLVISAWISKPELGIYLWCLSIATIVSEVISLGSNRILVRRIAAKAQIPEIIVGTALIQRTITAIIFFVFIAPILWPFRTQIPNFSLLLITFGIMVLWQHTLVAHHLLQARQRFWALTFATQAGLYTKLGLGVLLSYLGYGISGLLWALFIGFFIDGILGIFLSWRNDSGSFKPRVTLDEVKQLNKEGLPLLTGSVFDWAIARADWFFLGILRTFSEVGEYAFAYRLFEFTWMPHAVLNMLVMPKISIWLRDKLFSKDRGQDLTELINLATALAALIPVVLITSWTPIIDYLTAGKYGASNQLVITILFLSTPFAAAVSMCWAISIALVRNRQIMFICIFISILNVALNLVLIPPLGNKGAAIAAVIGFIIQCGCYLYILRDGLNNKRVLLNLSLVVFWSLSSLCVANFIGLYWLFNTMIATAIYIVGILVTSRLDYLKVIHLLKSN